MNASISYTENRNKKPFLRRKKPDQYVYVNEGFEDSTENQKKVKECSETSQEAGGSRNDLNKKMSPKPDDAITTYIMEIKDPPIRTEKYKSDLRGYKHFSFWHSKNMQWMDITSDQDKHCLLISKSEIHKHTCSQNEKISKI